MSQPSTRQFGFIVAQVIAVVALMFATYFLHRVAEFSAVCFKSQIVDRLVLFSEKAALPHCNQNWGWSGNWRQIPDHWSLHWPRVAAKAERLTEVWPLPPTLFKVVVVTEEPFISDRDGAQLIVGGVVAHGAQTWLKELIKAWVEVTTMDLLPLEHAILSDFLAAVAEGSFSLEGLGGVTKPGTQINWNSSAIRPDEYCTSPWRDARDYDFCLVDYPGEVGRLRGLKSLFARALWDFYNQADWNEQRALWRWLRSDVALGKAPFIKLEGRPLPGIDRLNLTLVMWSKKIFRTPERQARAMYVVKARLKLNLAASPYVIIEANKKLEKRSHEIQSLVRINGELEWWSSGERMKSFDPRVIPLHLVKIGCDLPTVGALSNVARKTVLFIKSCHPENLTGWDSLAEHDFKTFIAANPEAGILWVNVQGLKDAVESNMVSNSARVTLKRLRRWSQWQEDAWDKASLAFKPRAAIDLVLSHRATRDLL